jgi:hypothetical protein
MLISSTSGLPKFKKELRGQGFQALGRLHTWLLRGLHQGPGVHRLVHHRLGSSHREGSEASSNSKWILGADLSPRTLGCQFSLHLVIETARSGEKGVRGQEALVAAMGPVQMPADVTARALLGEVFAGGMQLAEEVLPSLKRVSLGSQKLA